MESIDGLQNAIGSTRLYKDYFRLTPKQEKQAITERTTRAAAAAVAKAAQPAPLAPKGGSGPGTSSQS